MPDYQSSMYPQNYELQLQQGKFMKFLESYVRMMDQQTIKKVLANVKCDETCELLHAGDCNVKGFIQFVMGVKSVFKMYLLAHLVPLLLFKLKKLKQNPRKQLWKFIVGLANSLMFAGLSSGIVRRTACLLTKYSSYNYTIARYPAVIASISIFFESPARRTQIALFCFSRGWETAYNMLKRRKYPVSIPYGNLLINGVSLALIAFAFLDDQTVIREGYRKVISLLLNDI